MDIPLRPINICVGCPCYALAEFLHKILSLQPGNMDSFMKNSEHFIKLIQEITFKM
jgi:hypothetical protein